MNNQTNNWKLNNAELQQSQSQFISLQCKLSSCFFPISSQIILTRIARKTVVINIKDTELYDNKNNKTPKSLQKHELDYNNLLP